MENFASNLHYQWLSIKPRSLYLLMIANDGMYRYCIRYTKYLNLNTTVLITVLDKATIIVQIFALSNFSD